MTGTLSGVGTVGSLLPGVTSGSFSVSRLLPSDLGTLVFLFLGDLDKLLFLDRVLDRCLDLESDLD